MDKVAKTVCLIHMWRSRRAIREQRRADPTIHLVSLLHKLNIRAAGPALCLSIERRIGEGEALRD